MGSIVAHGGAKWAIARRTLRPPLPPAGAGRGRPGPGHDRRGARRGPDPPWPARDRRRRLGRAHPHDDRPDRAPVAPPRAAGAPRPGHRAPGPAGQPGRGQRRGGGAGAVPVYRLEVTGRVARPLSLDLKDLRALPAHGTVLPIACVEGWSYSAPWSGVRIRDLLAMAGAEPDRTILIESLEPQGAYRTSTLNAEPGGRPRHPAGAVTRRRDPRPRPRFPVPPHRPQPARRPADQVGQPGGRAVRPGAPRSASRFWITAAIGWARDRVGRHRHLLPQPRHPPGQPGPVRRRRRPAA